MGFVAVDERANAVSRGRVSNRPIMLTKHSVGGAPCSKPLYLQHLGGGLARSGGPHGFGGATPIEDDSAKAGLEGGSCSKPLYLQRLEGHLAQNHSFYCRNSSKSTGAMHGDSEQKTCHRRSMGKPVYSSAVAAKPRGKTEQIVEMSLVLLRLHDADVSAVEGGLGGSVLAENRRAPNHYNSCAKCTYRGLGGHFL